jgi:hypothetical protein
MPEIEHIVKEQFICKEINDTVDRLEFDIITAPPPLHGLGKGYKKFGMWNCTHWTVCGRGGAHENAALEKCPYHDMSPPAE